MTLRRRHRRLLLHDDRSIDTTLSSKSLRGAIHPQFLMHHNVKSLIFLHAYSSLSRLYLSIQPIGRKVEGHPLISLSLSLFLALSLSNSLSVSMLLFLSLSLSLSFSSQSISSLI